MSGLSIETRAALLTGGKRGPAIVPGKASESLLYKAAAREGELKMPPGNKAVSAEDLAAVRQWIDAGAPSVKEQKEAEPAWWSFRKPVRPAAKSIDQLLGKAGTAADRRTLIRRATYDLLGLPPTPAETEAFVNDRDRKPGRKSWTACWLRRNMANAGAAGGWMWRVR